MKARPRRPEDGTIAVSATASSNGLDENVPFTSCGIRGSEMLNLVSTECKGALVNGTFTTMTSQPAGPSTQTVTCTLTSP